MSYIKCTSFLKDKEVEYGLIDVKLKHKKLDSDYGALCSQSRLYWNTSPEETVTQRCNQSSLGNPISKFCMTVTGRQTQSYYLSGVLTSEYGYVTRGKQPVISNSLYTVDDMEIGFSTFDLFETKYMKYELECYVDTASSIYAGYTSLSFVDVEGNTVEAETIKGFRDISVIGRLKQNNEIASYYNLADDASYIPTLITEFSVNTEIFRIQDFVPKYTASTSWHSSGQYFYDNESGTENSILTDDGFTDTANDIIGIAVALMGYHYWKTVGRNDSVMYEKKVLNSDLTELTKTEKRNLVTSIHTGYILNEVDNNSDTFINFTTAYPYYGINNILNLAASNYIATTFNSEGNYIVQDSTSSSSDELASSFFTTPIIIGYVTQELAEFGVSDSKSNGVYVSLTDTVYDGDPSSDDDDDNDDNDDDDWGNEEWDPPYDYIEPADDPSTDYTPVLPSWITPGHKTYTYPGDDVISGEPGAYNLYRPSYSNYVFKRYYRKTEEWDQDSAWEFVNDCTNASISEPFHALFKIVSGHPTIGETIARVYELPFEYSELINTSAAYHESAPVYGYIGFITCSFNGDGSIDQDDVRYYKELTNRFYSIDLGSINIQKVFDNYLDYTDTKYKLNLPYGAGIVEIDPSFLFNVGRVTASIQIKGYLDVDTGFLIIKVIINSQLYYETSVNVAVDRLATSSDNIALPLTLTKLIGGAVVVPQVTSQITQARYLGQSEARIEERRQIEKIKTEEERKRQIDLEESTMRIIEYRSKRGV